MAEMKKHYNKTAVKELSKSLGVSNFLAVPRIEKVVINAGVGRLLSSTSNAKDFLSKISEDISSITGQKPVVTKARKSIASFKVREGQPVGLKVTLRGQRMYDFLDRFISVALPRSRDFKGIDPKGIDKSGNLTFGLAEHNIFPETAESNINFGFEITIVTTAEDKDGAIKLFEVLGFPLKKDKKDNG